MNKYNYLIVGQGLAGSLLAHCLEEQNCRFKIIDTGINNSSVKAAGIINPIVFRRTTKSWLVDECFPDAIKRYAFLEQKLGASFLFHRTIRRAFSSEQERNEWSKKAKTETYAAYIRTIEEEETKAPDYLKQIHGNSLVHKACYIESGVFIEANRKYFEGKGALIRGKFDYSLVTDSELVLEGDCFEKVIFCEGYEGRNNPFFNYLPLTQTKGQVLTLKVNGIDNKTEILNRKCFLLPQENGLFKAGSSYEWDNSSLHPTEEVKQEIVQHLNQLIDLPFEITDHEVGIRPTVIDRRPLIGQHPDKKNLFIFNGFGAKGYLLCPYFALEFVAHLKNNTALHPEVQISRFKKK